MPPVTSGTLLFQEPPSSRHRLRPVEWIEHRLTALRLRLLEWSPFARRWRFDPSAADVVDVPVASLDAGRRERMLWRVHDAARVAHRAWESGDDPSDAMRDLSVALARVAEFDV
jgi:hypothetical protein